MIEALRVWGADEGFGGVDWAGAGAGRDIVCHVRADKEPFRLPEYLPLARVSWSWTAEIRDPDIYKFAHKTVGEDDATNKRKMVY